ncbi:hypothetical protein V6N13_040055 [Hibiscus sabdariffa]|uniref:NB-ARC domain-containing protein n=1 Tax=Hibiscus sabdariffa TaxID=183260 RepID=A0ABR2STL3_9ROSI
MIIGIKIIIHLFLEEEDDDLNLQETINLSCELREVALDADDLLEEFGPDTMIQENDNGLVEKLSNIVPALRPFMTYHKRLSELKPTRQRLDVLLSERSNFKGSKVIVTTRSAKVAAIMGTMSSVHLKGLSHDEFWALFKQCAFANDAEDYPNLLPIGCSFSRKVSRESNAVQKRAR